MIVTQRYDLRGHVSGYTVTDAQPVERFAQELLDNADGMVLSWDPVTRRVTITGENGTWVYDIIEADPLSPRTLVGTIRSKT